MDKIIDLYDCCDPENSSALSQIKGMYIDCLSKYCVSHDHDHNYIYDKIYQPLVTGKDKKYQAAMYVLEYLLTSDHSDNLSEEQLKLYRNLLEYDLPQAALAAKNDSKAAGEFANFLFADSDRNSEFVFK